MESRPAFGSFTPAGTWACFVVVVAMPAAAQVTSRASVDSGGIPANSDCTDPVISADGRYIVFQSPANNLVPGDTNGVTDVFVHDLFTGTTERVSVDSAGMQGNGISYKPSLSADGRWSTFLSAASNLVGGDTNGTGDAFVRDRLAGTTERASVDSAGMQGNGGCDATTISASGRYVAFGSIASNLVPGDTNGEIDVFVRDRVAGTTERVSVSSGGAQGNGECFVPSISPGGRFVVFGSAATNLVLGDTNAREDVFVRDRLTGTTERVSVDSGGAQGNGDSNTCSISDDGRYTAFESESSNLVAGDTNGFRDVFVRDRVAGTTVRVSVDSGGMQANGTSAVPSISIDGRHVAFYGGATNLVVGDTNGVLDVFVHDLISGTTERMSIDSAGVEGNSNAFQPTISGTGRFFAFWSFADNLVPGNTNFVADVFVRDRFAASFPSLCDPGVDGVIACPCANPPVSPGRGCDNHSALSGGAAMAGSGNASLSWDSVALGATDENSTALSVVWTGSNRIAPPGVVHAAGVRCVGGLHRLYSGSASGGVIVRPAGLDSTVSARSAAVGAPIGAGQTRYYFTIYRDPLAAAPCGNSSSTVNLSNVVQVTFSP